MMVELGSCFIMLPSRDFAKYCVQGVTVLDITCTILKSQPRKHRESMCFFANIEPHEAVPEVSKGKIHINQKNMCL